MKYKLYAGNSPVAKQLMYETDDVYELKLMYWRLLERLRREDKVNDGDIKMTSDSDLITIDYGSYKPYRIYVSGFKSCVDFNQIGGQ